MFSIFFSDFWFDVIKLRSYDQNQVLFLSSCFILILFGLGSLSALIASNAMSLHQTGINFASNLCKSPYW